MKESMRKAIDLIVAERCAQDTKWGYQDHTPLEWYGILGEEFGEVGKEVIENHFRGKSLDNYLIELIQVAAVAVAMIENHLDNSGE